MHPKLRAILIVLFTSALLLTAAPEALAQMGAGGAGGGGGGGAGSRGGGSRGGRESKPRPKRNEIPPVDPAAAREKLQTALVVALKRGTGNPMYLVNLFEQASTGAVPASAQSRKALAEALSAGTKGKKLDESAATAVAEPVVVLVNMDGVAPEEVEAKKDPLKEALSSAGLSEEQTAAALAAAEQMIADQQNEAVKKVMDDFEEIQKEGTVGDDRKKTLAENLVALAPESRPGQAQVTKLAEDLAKGLDAAQLTNKEKAQLAFDIRAVMTMPDAPPAQFMPRLNQVRSILKAGLVKQADIQAIATDLQALHKSLGSGPEAGAPDAPEVPTENPEGAPEGERGED